MTHLVILPVLLPLLAGCLLLLASRRGLVVRRVVGIGATLALVPVATLLLASVLDGTQSVVWDQAENRLHAQKALLEFLLLGAR